MTNKHTTIEKRKNKARALVTKRETIVQHLQELQSNQRGMRQWIEHADVSEEVVQLFRSTLKGMSREIAHLTHQQQQIEHRIAELERAIALLEHLR